MSWAVSVFENGKLYQRIQYKDKNKALNEFHRQGAKYGGSKCHEVDTTGVLADIQLEDSTPSWKKNLDSKKANEKKKKTADERFKTAMQVLFDGINPVELSEVVEYFSTEDKPVSEKTIRRWVKNNGDFEVKNNQISPREEPGTK